MPRTDKRKTIMQAAEKLFASRRYHEITVDDIVREAHVGKGTVYTYFKDKDDLFFQVAMSGFDELCDLIRCRVSGDAPLRERLLQACAATSAFFARRRQLFRMIQSEDARMSLCHGDACERWKERRQQLVEVLREILHAGQSDGDLRDDLAAEPMANFLLGLLRARARDMRDGGDVVSDDLVVDLFLNGARRPGTPARRARREERA